MLQKLSDHIAYCHQRARDCAVKAGGIGDPHGRQEYLASERRWLLLATSYELTERLTDYTAEMKRRISLSRPAVPPTPGVPRVMCPDCGHKMRLRLVAPHPNTARRAETSTFECACGRVYQQTIGLPLRAK